MVDRRTRVCVIGAGVIGLSTAYRLQDALPNVDITIVSEEFSPNTTGDGSAGFWRPYLVTGTPDELVWYAYQNKFYIGNFTENVAIFIVLMLMGLRLVKCQIRLSAVKKVLMLYVINYHVGPFTASALSIACDNSG